MRATRRAWFSVLFGFCLLMAAGGAANAQMSDDTPSGGTEMHNPDISDARAVDVRAARSTRPNVLGAFATSLLNSKQRPVAWLVWVRLPLLSPER